jgi:hypothetical protein
MIRFERRDVVVEGPEAPPLSQAALEAARALMPGADVYALEADWRSYWASTGRPRLRSADAAFVGFVQTRAARDKPAR